MYIGAYTRDIKADFLIDFISGLFKNRRIITNTFDIKRVIENGTSKIRYSIISLYIVYTVIPNIDTAHIMDVIHESEHWLSCALERRRAIGLVHSAMHTATAINVLIIIIRADELARPKSIEASRFPLTPTCYALLAKLLDASRTIPHVSAGSRLVRGIRSRDAATFHVRTKS